MEENFMTNKTPMSKEAAARIQSNSAKSGTNQSFAKRAQSAADKNNKS
jgi:hypothetical protein